MLEKLSTGKMPPPGLPAPSGAERSAVIRRIESTLRLNHREVTPGRVTARRLNRVEYNNTIRDLLGVPARPADDFPVDDSGYGFDNIGDVLTVSPMLMEKYTAAARKVSRLAVCGETLPEKPTVLARLMARRSYDGGSFSGSHYLPYSMRGALYGTWMFPADAEYELRFRVMNLRNEEETPADPDAPPRRRSLSSLTPEEKAERDRALQRVPTPEALRASLERSRLSAAPLRLTLAVDGVTVLTGVIEGSTSYGYDRGEFVARVPLKAGEHFLRASFPELADLENPRRHLNTDLRRKVFVDYLDVVGPITPAVEPRGYRRVFVCGHSRTQHDKACAGTILRDVTRRAWRRPVTRNEIDSLERLAAMVQKDGESFEEGIRVALQAILVSPHFLFRPERDTGASAVVSEHELASRLSYFLWASMPDEELLRAADEKALRKPGVLEAQVKRMLADAKSLSLVEDFAEQWLQLRDLDRKRPAPERFPGMDDELLDAMRRETRLFVGEVFRSDRGVLDLLDARFTFVNGPLARHYGIAGIRGEDFQRVSLDGGERGGLLTQGAILTVSSYPTRTSPVIRGKWVLENLLGTPPPPPPPDVPELDEAKIGLTASLREQLEQHRARPACAVCHNQMDALGFGLENFDATGAWRTHDGKFPIDASGTLPDGKSFRGPAELKGVLRAQADLFARNLAEKLLTYALGRGLEPYDKGAVDEIMSQTRALQYRFSAMVMGIVQSRPFQMRAAAGGKP
ncbi:MAG: DUF1592 domain-containing protein [Bryobacteraceae bacterium]